MRTIKQISYKLCLVLAFAFFCSESSAQKDEDFPQLPVDFSIQKNKEDAIILTISNLTDAPVKLSSSALANPRISYVFKPRKWFVDGKISPSRGGGGTLSDSDYHVYSLMEKGENLKIEIPAKSSIEQNLSLDKYIRSVMELHADLLKQEGSSERYSFQLKLRLLDPLVKDEINKTTAEVYHTNWLSFNPSDFVSK